MKAESVRDRKRGQDTMRRKTMKVMAMAMTMALVVGGMTMPMTVHAGDHGYDDGCDHGSEGCADPDGFDCYVGGDDSDSGSSSGGGSSDSGYSGGGSSDSGSGSSSGSHDSGSHSTDGAGGGSGDNGGGNGAGGSGAPAVSSTPTVRRNYTPGTQTTAGKQDFRAVVKAGAGTYRVIHKGSDVMTFTLKDADGKAKACDRIELKTLADGRWAINFVTGDAAGCTIGAPLDRTYMFNELGVSCVTINDTVVIDIEAEAAAK